jgi:hypothetical protein
MAPVQAMELSTAATRRDLSWPIFGLQTVIERDE